MSTVTITARTLSKLVDPVLPHASADFDLPLLASLLIREQGDWLTALATDRYTLAMQRVPMPKPEPTDDGVVEIATPDAGEPFAALIPRTVLARIRSIFKATRHVDPAITLTIDGELLTVTSADTLDGLVGAALTFQLPNAVKAYPDLSRLIEPALAAAVAPPAEVSAGGAFAPRLLASFATGQSNPDAAIITPSDSAGHKPWLVQIGEDFIGLIVPVRHGLRPADLATWQALVTPTADAAVAA